MWNILGAVMTEQEFRELVAGYAPTPFEVEDDAARFFPGAHYLQIHAARFFRIVKFLKGADAPRNLLDLGCYPGTLFNVLQALMPKVQLAGAGLGLSQEFRALFPNVTLYEVNFDPDIYFEEYLKTPTTLDMPAGSFQIITATEIFEHLYNPLHLVRAAARLLARGGYFYLTTNNISYLPGIARLVRGGTNLDQDIAITTLTEGKTAWRGHVRFYSKRELEEVMRRAGFTDVRVNYFTEESWYPDKRTGTLKRAMQGMLNRTGSRYGSHLEVIGKK